MVRLAAVTVALALLVPGAASAAFAPTAAPFGAGNQLDDFDANDARWIASARVDHEARIAVSADQGASWTPVTDPGGSQYVDVSAAPDGSVWFGGSKTADTDAGGVVYRVAAGSSTAAAVTYAGFGLGDPATGHRYETSAPLWDAAGKAWAAVTVHDADGASRHLVQLETDGGAVAHRIPLASQYDVTLDRLGRQIYLLGSEHRRLDGTTLVTVGGVPEWRSGDRAVDGAGRRSSDGGMTFHGGTSSFARAVQNAPDLAIAGRSVLSTYAHGLSPTGLTDVPEGWLDAVRTDDGVAVPGQDGVVYLHAGSVPVTPPATGAQVRRVNTLRTAAGLAPVREDPRLTQAAAAHVNYWKLNGFSAHDEFDGLPGFTGSDPSDRCRAAGYPEGCGEVAYPELSTWAVDGWIATPYHGRPLVDPDATDLGGAELDGVGANINSSLPRGIRFTPAPFPHGTFDGDLLATGENPDPVDACLDSGQDIDWPIGQTIFLGPPTGGTASVTGLARVADGVPLHGCRLEGMFLPDDPLTSYTAYRATGVWNGTDDGPDQTIQWEFTTGAGHNNPLGGTTATTTTVTTGTTIVQPGGAGLRAGFGRLRLPRLAAFARRGMTVPLTCAPACRASVRLTARLGRRTVTLGRSKPSALSTRPALRLKVAAKLRRKVRRLRRLAVRIHVSAAADGGRPMTFSHRVTLRR